MSAPVAATEARKLPEYPQLLGHPRPLWMLFMSEFWERFAFYGMRWALTLYIVAEFFQGNQSGQGYASATYGAYLALVYASAIFGGYAADKLIGYQRSILVGAVVMAIGLFMITIPNKEIFLLGLAVVIMGNGLFKPNISAMVGQLYAQGDERRDRAFTIFYMGINAGALIAPLLTGWLASHINGTPVQQNYKIVFYATGAGMLVSLIWFYFGRAQLKGIGLPPPEQPAGKAMGLVLGGVVLGIPLVYALMAYLGAKGLAVVLLVMFIGVGASLVMGATKGDKVSIQRVYAMLLLFAFNVMFWCFFEQAGSSFNFLAQNMVDREMFGWIFPVGWFQSVNPGALVVMAPIVAMVWGFLALRNAEPSIPRKFALGLAFNAVGFAVLMYALTHLVAPGSNLIPFWTLAACYVFQTIGELCLSPIGLSMVTKLAPPRMVGLAMGGWFLSTANGNNFSGLVAEWISGETGINVELALKGFTFSFWTLIIGGVILWVLGPLINKLMHGVK